MVLRKRASFYGVLQGHGITDIGPLLILVSFKFVGRCLAFWLSFGFVVNWELCPRTDVLRLFRSGCGLNG